MRLSHVLVCCVTVAGTGSGCGDSGQAASGGSQTAGTTATTDNGSVTSNGTASGTSGGLGESTGSTTGASSTSAGGNPATATTGDGGLTGTGTTASTTGNTTSVGGSGGTATVATVTGTTSTGGSNTGTGPCDAPGLMLCDDFEGSAVGSEPGAPTWLPQAEWKSPRIVVDNTVAHASTNSVKVVGSSAEGNFLMPAMGFPPANNSFYVRVWVQLSRSTETIASHAGFIVGAEQESNAGEEMRLGASNGMLDVNLIPGNKGTGAGGEITRFSNGDTTGGNPTDNPGLVLEAGVWYCLEAFFNGAEHDFQVWLNDTEIVEMHIQDWGEGRSGWSPDYNVLKIGAQNYSGDAGELWYDDIAVGTQRIYCNGL